MNNEIYPGVILKNGKIWTRNLVPGEKVYGEIIRKFEGAEHRSWDPKRSKLGAGIKKRIKTTGIKEGDKILYLGASTGTTPSHVSDIVGKEGFVFAMDFAPRVLRELIFLTEKRKNMMPILGDANKPKEYFKFMQLVDVVYQDIAQKNQVEIFQKNCDLYLKKGGYGILCLKARSIDVTRKPKSIFKEVEQELKQKFEFVDGKDIEPFEVDHMIYVVRKK